MAPAFKKACRHPTCAAVVDRGYCPMHQPRRGSVTQQGYGAEWAKTSKRILERDPICRICNRRRSKQVDHIIARREGGSEDDHNLRGLCRSCHARKTVADDGGYLREFGGERK